MPGGRPTKLLLVAHHPWLRQKKEPARAYECFKGYLDLGSGRSLGKLAGKIAASCRQLERWSSRWDWVARCTAYDNHIAAIEQRAKEAEAAKEAAKWVRRRDEWREKSYSIAESLIEKAVQMLKFPLAEVKKQDGDRVTIVEPSRWTLKDAATVVATADKLARLAAEMETERSRVEVNDTTLTDEERAAQIAAILNRAQERKAANE